MKAQKKLKYSGLPQITTGSGDVLGGSSQSIMRYLSKSYKSTLNKTEFLYKGKDNAQESYEIDEVLELSSDLKSHMKFMEPNDPSFDGSIEAMQSFCNGKWDQFLRQVNDKITQSGESIYYIIGEKLTLADVVISSYFLRFMNDRELLHGKILMDHLEQNYGKVYEYAYFQNQTFKDWYLKLKNYNDAEPATNDGEVQFQTQNKHRSSR